jgi:hypothetical protein
MRRHACATSRIPVIDMISHVPHTRSIPSACAITCDRASHTSETRTSTVSEIVVGLYFDLGTCLSRYILYLRARPPYEGRERYLTLPPLRGFGNKTPPIELVPCCLKLLRALSKPLTTHQHLQRAQPRYMLLPKPYVITPFQLD